MSGMSETLTKGEFLAAAVVLLKGILCAEALKTALEHAAAGLGIPDPIRVVEGLLAREVKEVAEVEKDKEVKGKKSGKKEKAENKKEKKEKKDKRAMSPYNAFVAWYADFAAHFGRHPVVVQLKAENPGKTMAQSSSFFRTLHTDKKKGFEDSLRPFLAARHAEHKEAAVGSPEETGLDVVKAYDRAHPDATIGTLVGLQALEAYVTDPAVMKSEAAAVRKAGITGSASAAAAPVPSNGVVDSGDDEMHEEEEVEAEEVEAEEEAEAEDEEAPPPPLPKASKKADKAAAAATESKGRKEGKDKKRKNEGLEKKEKTKEAEDEMEEIEKEEVEEKKEKKKDKKDKEVTSEKKAKKHKKDKE